ncbi:MAG TPA: hypothetical protein VFE60_07440 [Roseiarcus sp.]|jgi:hypothetical protein|nr:hypothetical protein [Roseiarcus sp.]
MAGSFATLEVGDPHDTMQSLSEHFAPPAGETQQYWARTYEAADWRRYKIEPNAHRTLVSVGLIGGVGGQAGLTCLSSFKDQAAKPCTPGRWAGAETLTNTLTVPRGASRSLTASAGGLAIRSRARAEEKPAGRAPQNLCAKQTLRVLDRGGAEKTSLNGGKATNHD